MVWATRPVYGQPVAASVAAPLYGLGDYGDCWGWREGVGYGGPVVDINQLASGYNAVLPNVTATQVLMPVPLAQLPTLGTMVLGQIALGTPARNPNIGAFVRGGDILPENLGDLGEVRYVPYSAPEGRIGAFVIGESPIGHAHQTHKVVTFAPNGGPEIEQP